MKILHVCLSNFFVDNHSYQENMLPKFHKKMGLDVEVIASTRSFDEFGNGCDIEPAVYENEYGIKVTRLPYKKSLTKKVAKLLRFYEGFQPALDNAAPDIIFIHGCQFCDIRIIAEYAKVHEVAIYVDNHADFTNSATNWISKNILHKIIWKNCAHKIEPYTKKFYGVLPARVDFLKDLYGIPAEKCELLVMGVDDDLVEKAKNTDARNRIREKYGIANKDFLIITGGKIDQWKTQTLLLMEAVHNIANPHVRLIVFGSVTKELMDQVNCLSDGTKVQYIGWITSAETYDYFEAADLVVFPGRHSVLWEQVVGQGKPMIVKDLPGTHHIDLGGNVLFLTKDTVEEIQYNIESLISDPSRLTEMTRIAESKGMQNFSYADISKRSIR